MNLESLQTGLESLDTFKLDKFSEESRLDGIQNPLADYVIKLNDNWVTDDVDTSLNLTEDIVEPKTADNNQVHFNDNINLVVDLEPSSVSLDSAQFSSENDATQERQRFDNIAFFKAGGSKWSQPGGKGNPVNITYSYTNLLDGSIKGLSAGTIKAAIEESFGVWSSVAPLNFTEVKDSPRNSQIRIGQEYIDGRDGTLAYAYFPRNGDMRFDSGERWDVNFFMETAVHEIGHALGLDHEDNVTAIMNSYAGSFSYKGLGTAFLLQDDIKGIRSIYGRGKGSVNPLAGNPPTPPPSNPKRINGTMGDDDLIGNDRNNRIRGFAGDDYLEGGKGNDNIKGGKGADTFAFKSLDGSVDIIKDFSIKEGDRIEISGSGFGASSTNEFDYDAKSGGLFFGNEKFAIFENKPSSSDISSRLAVI